MKKQVLLFLSLILILFSKSFAQILPAGAVTGNNPLDVKWRYIDSKALKVIFPAGNETEAIRLVNVINFISDSAAVSVGEKRLHLDMLLQTNQVVSNGYVGLSPYRSELYGTGIQNINVIGTIGFLDVLAFHEYRHALQYANDRRGFTKFLYIIGGETMWSLGQNLSIPDWYFEGDAVQTETVLSGAGRGRNPFFFHEQRALLLNGKHYSYAKARNGSFKSMMPDHYRLGYAMLNQVRKEQGPDAWRKILKDAGSYKGVFYPFSSAMKRHSGYNSKKTYARTYDTLYQRWTKELATLTLSDVKTVTAEPKFTVTNYEWPYVQADGSIICRREAYNRTQELVQIKGGKEKVLAVMGLMVTESYLSVNDQVAMWAELTTDPRWLNRNYLLKVAWRNNTV